MTSDSSAKTVRTCVKKSIRRGLEKRCDRRINVLVDVTGILEATKIPARGLEPRYPA
jgi:hypothetical protein